MYYVLEAGYHRRFVQEWLDGDHADGELHLALETSDGGHRGHFHALLCELLVNERR